jgi:hypothetical protein
VVEPSTGNNRETIKMCYVVGSEEGSENVADKTTDSVLGEDIERIVNAEDELQLGGVLKRY